MKPVNLIAVLLIASLMTLSGCIRYSFTGVAIPADVRTIYIPFFPDNSTSGLAFLSDDLNEALINRFVNQSRLQLTSNADEADAVLDGRIVNYRNSPFSVAGDQRATLNRVDITVRASFKYRTEERPEWDKSFNGVAEFDPNEDPIDGERNAVLEAMGRVAQNMFNDALGSW
jgi:hypothetical protein